MGSKVWLSGTGPEIPHAQCNQSTAVLELRVDLLSNASKRSIDLTQAIPTKTPILSRLSYTRNQSMLIQVNNTKIEIRANPGLVTTRLIAEYWPRMVVGPYRPRRSNNYHYWGLV